MKKIILAFSFLMVSTAVFAQGPTQAQMDCFQKAMENNLKKVYSVCKVSKNYNIVKNPDLIEKLPQEEQECITTESQKYSEDMQKAQEKCFQ